MHQDGDHGILDTDRCLEDTARASVQKVRFFLKNWLGRGHWVILWQEILVIHRDITYPGMPNHV